MTHLKLWLDLELQMGMLVENEITPAINVSIDKNHIHILLNVLHAVR